MNNNFLVFLNTKQALTNHRKGADFINSFKLYDSELAKWNVTRAQLETMPEITVIQDRDEGHRYNVTGVNVIDFSLVRPTGRPLTDLHLWMRDRALETELPEGTETTDYWQRFMKYRDVYPELFFNVDLFAGRVHTPISGMHRVTRPFLLLRNEPTGSLDVSQMQPTLLATILLQAVGTNSFSDAINAGTDVYVMLQEKAKLKDRDEAKKRFFKILFGYPDEKLSQLFEGANWIDWINSYKSQTEIRNPHKERQHSNLAWLLQTFEVQIMTEIWRTLAENALPFVTVHDEIIVQQNSLKQAEAIMNNELSKHFINFKINAK